MPVCPRQWASHALTRRAVCCGRWRLCDESEPLLTLDRHQQARRDADSRAVVGEVAVKTPAVRPLQRLGGAENTTDISSNSSTGSLFAAAEVCPCCDDA